MRQGRLNIDWPPALDNMVDRNGNMVVESIYNLTFQWAQSQITQAFLEYYYLPTVYQEGVYYRLKRDLSANDKNVPYLPEGFWDFQRTQQAAPPEHGANSTSTQVQATPYSHQQVAASVKPATQPRQGATSSYAQLQATPHSFKQVAAPAAGPVQDKVVTIRVVAHTLGPLVPHG
ncbi:hypothetical protein EJ08DRAFT_701933 [Tothia fuscella]|uniref:Uncharacterized protein n=1 Tax=Tothia fuscella TaxID=1048955 RepID=A0A9P4TUB5_9PEZI|nr:hypothetical protein EJ08DRAFT_701933 [Tothia fuscella]